MSIGTFTLLTHCHPEPGTSETGYIRKKQSCEVAAYCVGWVLNPRIYMVLRSLIVILRRSRRIWAKKKVVLMTRQMSHFLPRSFTGVQDDMP